MPFLWYLEGMVKKVASLDAFFQEARAGAIREIEVTSRVVTTVPAGGERVVYRGRIIVRALLSGQVLEYVELVKPLAQTSGAVAGPTSDKETKKLPKDAPAQHRRLANQLRYYREAFEWRLNEAKERIIGACKAAGFAIALSGISSIGETSSEPTEPTQVSAGERLGLRRLGETTN
jgi:hypothetical protein